jgi:HK97 family phage portal protein
MRWFGRKAERIAARPFLLRGWGSASGEPWPRSYEAQVREAFLHNPVAQRAVRLVAEGVAGSPIYVLENGTGASTSSARAVSLVSGPLLETMAAQLLLHGNCFVQILQDAEGEPAELFALRPERVSVEPDSGGWPAAYVYKAGEAKTRLAARDGLGRPSLVHLKAMHPLDDHYGARLSLERRPERVAIHNAATKWNKALLDNAARPSGALLFDPGDGGGAFGRAI